MSGPSTSTVGSKVTVSYSLVLGSDDTASTYKAYSYTVASCSGGTVNSYGQSSTTVTITSLPCRVSVINYYDSGWNTMTSVSGSWTISAASSGDSGGGTTVTPWVNAPGKPVYAGDLKPGGALTVSWTRATGYTTVYYTVQRQVNVGSWVTVNASTTATSIADTLPGDALTAAYRVMAKSSTASSAYVTGDTVALNSPPSDPLWISYGTPYANREIVLTCPDSADPEGDNFEYIWEGRADSNAYTTVAVTAEPAATVIVPNAGITVQYRVKAVDVHGAESGYATGSPKAIIYNYPPVISGADKDEGPVKAPFTYDFSIDDPDEDDILSATVKLDGNVLLELDDVVRNQIYKAKREPSQTAFGWVMKEKTPWGAKPCPKGKQWP